MRAAGRAGARIAVTGAVPSSAAVRSFLRAELDGVRLLELGDGEASSDALAFDDALRGADVLVFVGDGSEVAAAEHTAALASAARERGMLVVAIVVDGGLARGPSRLLAVLRDAADMVMILRDAADAHAVVAALR